MAVSPYVLLHHKYLQDFERLLKKKDYPQASEKLWGATAELVKVIAQRRGWKHHAHRDLLVAMSRLEEETGDPDLRHLFDAAQALHSNFYENFMSPSVFLGRVGEARSLLGKLRALNGHRKS